MDGTPRADLPDAIFRAAAEASGEYLVVADVAGTMLWVNGRFADLGWTPADVVGRPGLTTADESLYEVKRDAKGGHQVRIVPA